MINFAMAGSLDYLHKSANYFSERGYNPTAIIEKSAKGGESIEDRLEELKENSTELLICVAYPDILTDKVLDSFDKGCINLHAGLPKYRGRHPLNWMLIDGLKEIPVSVHYMDKGIDTGDIILQDSFIVERNENYNSALEKITNLGTELLFNAVRQIENDTVYRIKQHKSELGYTRKRTPEDSRIDWSKSSEELFRFVNALVDPMPNAYGFINGKEVTLKESNRGENVGEVISKVDDSNYVISTTDGVILVKSESELNVGDRFDF